MQLQRCLPVVLSFLFRKGTEVMTVIVLGHLGKDELAAGALALSTTATLAYSVFVGLAAGTTTLVSQAHGAGDKEQVTLWLHRAIVVHLGMAIPLSVLLTLLGPLLRLMGQEATLASSAGTFGFWLLPAVWAWALNWALIPWLQSQGIVRPQFVCAAAIAVLHPLFLYGFVHVLRLGMLGAAVANSLSLCTMTLLIAIAIAGWSRRIGAAPMRAISRASFERLPTFLHLGLPGVLMMSEWWASEVRTRGLQTPRPQSEHWRSLRSATTDHPHIAHARCNHSHQVNILLAGLLPSPEVALSSMSCYQTTNSVCFMLAVGCSVAGGQRVGAALGRGDATAARRAAAVCVALGASFATIC